MEPLLADDVAACIAFVATRPPQVNIDYLMVRPRDQPSNWHVHRRPETRCLIWRLKHSVQRDTVAPDTLDRLLALPSRFREHLGVLPADVAVDWYEDAAGSLRAVAGGEVLWFDLARRLRSTSSRSPVARSTGSPARTTVWTGFRWRSCSGGGSGSPMPPAATRSQSRSTS